MITTADIAREAGLSQRVVQKRAKMLHPAPRRAGLVMILTRGQADKIKAMSDKPGPKNK